jgi:hypothetical protein
VQRLAALDEVRSVLERIRNYVVEHDTFNDLGALNAKYVPAALQDEVQWLSDMAERLLDADPGDDGPDAVDVPPAPAPSA